jgi:hypothetical protein
MEAREDFISKGIDRAMRKTSKKSEAVGKTEKGSA